MNRDRYIQLCYEVVDCLHNLMYHESKGRGVGDDQWQAWCDKQLALLVEAKTMIDSELSEGTIECDGSLCAGNPTNENMHICDWCDKTEFGVFPDEYTEKGNDNE